MSEGRSTRTYQTRIHCTASELLSGYAKLMGRVERTLFARLTAGHKLNEIKRGFLKTFGITARQFNAARIALQGKIGSYEACRTLRIEALERQIRRAKQVLKECTLGSRKRHHKTRRLAMLQARLDRLKTDTTPRLCFGGRKLLRTDKAAWRAARSSQFFVIGSKDETAGCQGCVASVADDGSLTLRLRLPDALGKHLEERLKAFGIGP
jgi:hypothetical protein